MPIYAPKNATVEEITTLLDEKLSALKDDIVIEVRDSIARLFEAKLKEKDEKIEKLQSHVAMLQMHVMNLKQAHDEKLEELEQYGRRLCLRIDGVPHKEVETANEVLQTVKEKIDEVGADIPDVVIDRAHRVGAPFFDDSTHSKSQSIIVRFTTFRHRTLFYNKRKKLSKNVRIKLDLTKQRYNLLKYARERVENLENVKYVYADINCRLKVRMSDDKEYFFDSVDKLIDIVDPVYQA